jgi:hypothetical protein
MKSDPIDALLHKLRSGDPAVVEQAFLAYEPVLRMIFGLEACQPILGVTALESVGIVIDPASRQLKRLPAVPLKSMNAPIAEASGSPGQ